MSHPDLQWLHEVEGRLALDLIDRIPNTKIKFNPWKKRKLDTFQFLNYRN